MKLTEKQKNKKQALLQFYAENQKGKTRNQISKHWSKYRSKKFTIEQLPKHRKRLAKAKTTEQKQQLSEKYQERRFIKTAKLQYGGLQFQKKLKQTYSQQDFYKFKTKVDINDFEKLEKLNLDNTLQRLFADKKKNIRYILVTLKIKLEGTDQIVYLSDTFNPLRIETIKEENKTVIEKVLEKLTAIATYKGKIIGIFVRTVYDI